MSWEHELAKSMNNQGKPSLSSGWYTGEVISPVRTYNEEEGDYAYTGPLQISAFDGGVLLEADRLCRLADGLQLYQGLTVALLGDIFGCSAGGQKVLVLGVTHHAV